MRFYGAIGYGVTEETKPGVWESKIIEKEYYGDVLKQVSQNNFSNDKINNDIQCKNSISIIADPYAQNNMQNIKYVKIGDIKWQVSSVTVEYPRLILTLGGVYV